MSGKKPMQKCLMLEEEEVDPGAGTRQDSGCGADLTTVSAT